MYIMMKDICLHKTSLKGHRDSNEDVEAYNINLGHDGSPIDTSLAPVDFFLICDGHGGKGIAEIVSQDLQKFFMNRKHKYPLPNNLIMKAYHHIQKNIIKDHEKLATSCGCTALALVRFMEDGVKKIQVINLGDCRAVLSKKGIAIPLTKDHKPHWPDEKKRIEHVNQQKSLNKNIWLDKIDERDEGEWRIGTLSVSRSFGDMEDTPHVSHLPDVFLYNLTRDDEFIVMGCDGLWDVLQNHDVINFVRDSINQPVVDVYRAPEISQRENIARKLAEYAIFRGSSDNVSVFIIFFNNH